MVPGGPRSHLGALLAQARAGELGHIEFLQALCHDEIARRNPNRHDPTHISRFLLVPTLAETLGWEAVSPSAELVGTKLSVGFRSLSAPATERGYSSGRLLFGDARLAAHRLARAAHDAAQKLHPRRD